MQDLLYSALASRLPADTLESIIDGLEHLELVAQRRITGAFAGLDRALFPTTSSRHTGGTAASPTRVAGPDALTKALPNDAVQTLLLFCTPRDAAALAQTCTWMQQLITDTSDVGRVFWNARVQGLGWKHIYALDAPEQTWLQTRLRFVELELEFYREASMLVKASCCGHKPPPFVANVGRMPTPSIAYAVSCRRQWHMSNLIVPSFAEAQQFRKTHARISVSPARVSFLVRSELRKMAELAADADTSDVVRARVRPARPPIDAEGFVGYAVDLLELPPEHEYMRSELFETVVFRHLTVWESEQHVALAQARGQYGVHDVLWCTLDYVPQHVSDQPRFVLHSNPFGGFRPQHYRTARHVDAHVRRLHDECAALRNALALRMYV